MSSSAQLVLLPWLLGWEPPVDRTAFGAGLHAGSCVGIAWALRGDLRRLTARDGVVLLAASLPAAAAGALAADAVEQRLGRPPQLAALLAGAGALMWWVDRRATAREAAAAVTARRGRTPRAVPAPRPAGPGSRRDASTLAVGTRPLAVAALAQVVALAPGVSRLGATLTALRALGVDRAAARRAGLLMSLPVTAGAATLSLARADRTARRQLGPGLVVGVLAAGASSAAAATADRGRPGRPLTAAALYRLGLAAVVTRRLIREGAP